MVSGNKTPEKIQPGKKQWDSHSSLPLSPSLQCCATFDTFNYHHDLLFPSFFLYMILEMNYKQHFI